MKLKSSKLLVLLAASLMTVTACNNKPSEKPAEDEGDKQPEVIRLTSISLNKKTMTIEEKGGKDTLFVTYQPEGISNSQKSIIYTSSDDSIAAVDDFGTVTGIAPGTATITATSGVNASIFDTCVVTVTEKAKENVPVVSVTVTPATQSLDKGKSTYLSVEIKGKDDKKPTNATIIWSTDDSTVATVEGGKVTAVGFGTATIKATSESNPDVFGSCVITVKDNTVKVASIQLNPSSLEIIVGDLRTIQATVLGPDNTTPTDSSLLWEKVEESSTGVIEINQNGQVIAGKPGTATIKATAKDGSGVYATCPVVVSAKPSGDTDVHPTSVVFDSETPEVIYFNNGDITEYRFKASVLPTNVEDGHDGIHYEIKNGSNTATGTTLVEDPDTNSCVVTVGNVAGQFTIVATAIDQAALPQAAEFTVQVKDKITHVTRIDSTVSETKDLYVGNTVNLKPGSGVITVVPSDATNKNVNYISSNEAAVTVDDTTGLLRAVGIGSSDITVKSEQDPSVQVSFTINVKALPVEKVVISEKTLNLEVTKNAQLTADVFWQDPTDSENKKSEIESENVVFSSSDNSIATVTSDGFVSAVKTGSATITASYTEGGQTVKDTCLVTVLAKKPVVLSVNLPQAIQSFETKVEDQNLASVENIYKESVGGAISKGAFFKEDDAPEHADNLVYKVGDQGVFKLPTTVKARYYSDDASSDYTQNTDTIPVTYNWKMNGTAINPAEYLDNDNGNITFKTEKLSQTLNQKFTVSLNVEESSNYNIVEDFEPTEFTFKLIKGYNAYTLADLSFFDKHGAVSEQTINWELYRAEKEVPVSSIEGDLILHQDIAITSDVIPETMLWTKSEVDDYIGKQGADFTNWKNLLHISSVEKAKELLYNSPNDYRSLFLRNTSEGDDFALEGNFFSINASTLKQVKRESERTDGAEGLVAFQQANGCHGQIFGINVYSNVATDHPAGSVQMNNIKIIGNGGIQAAAAKVAAARAAGNDDLALELQGDVQLAKGGFICIKESQNDFSIRNMINQGSFIGILSEKHWGQDPNVSHTTLNRFKCYDSYNSSTYQWGTKYFTIDDSHLTGAGGPLILCDENNEGDKVNPFLQPCELVINNTYLNNPVAGTEPWFEQNNAATLVQAYLTGAGDPTNDQGWVGKIAEQAYTGLYAKAYICGVMGIDSATFDALYTAKNPDLLAALDQAAMKNARTITMKEGSGDNIVKKSNFIAIDINASNFGDNDFAQLNGKITINNGDDHPVLDMSKTSKTKKGSESIPVPHDIVGDDLTIEGNKAAALVAAGCNGGTAYTNASAVALVGDDQQAALNALVTSNYVSYYLDPVLAGNNFVSQYGFVGAILGTYSYEQYWA